MGIPLYRQNGRVPNPIFNNLAKRKKLHIMGTRFGFLSNNYFTVALENLITTNTIDFRCIYDIVPSKNNNHSFLNFNGILSWV